MLTKEDLENLENLKKEKNNLSERIKKLEKIPRKILIDGVKGSCTEFPYTHHTVKLEGFEDSLLYRKRKNTIKKLKKQYNDKQYRIDKEIRRIEYELNYVKDSEIREIIRMKYEDNLNWVQIMHKRGDNTDRTAAIKLERFFEKIKKDIGDTYNTQYNI